MARRKVLFVFLIILVIVGLVVPLRPSCSQNTLSPNLSEEPLTVKDSVKLTLIKDSDGDGYSDYFETNISKTDPQIPNQRYVLLIDTQLPIQFNFAVKSTYTFLTEKGKVKAENIVTLIDQEATAENIEKALGEMAEKVTKNDIFFLYINAHGTEGGALICNDGLGDAEKGLHFPYWYLDQYLDKIEAQAQIVMITACFTEKDYLYHTLKEENRIIIGTDYGGLLLSFLQSLGEKMDHDFQGSWQNAFNSGGWKELPPEVILIKEKYSSLAEVFQAIDKNGNGYISIGEALQWVNWLRWGTSEEYFEAELKNPCRINNLAFASELYFGDYRPEELKESK